MTNAIKDLILGIRKLREAATPGPWERDYQPTGICGSKCYAQAIQSSDKTEIVEQPHTNRMNSQRVFNDGAFIAAAPTNQERLEKALEIAVGFLESIESENESMDLATSATLKDIEAALRGDS
jgi:hypothetical protein